MPSLNETTPSGRRYWRSLDEIADTPEFRAFMHHEFPAGAASMLDSDGRRDFLKIMAASMALAGLGLGGCRRWPREEIAPFAARPTGRVPGKPVYYASAMPHHGAAAGVLVTAMDGRPIKIEGNPQHPVNRGRTDGFTQASVLDLYDPDRSRRVMHDGAPSSWNEFVGATGDLFRRHREGRGAGLAFLSEATSSPTAQAFRDRVRRELPEAAWHVWEPINNDEVVRGAEIAFGRSVRPLVDLSVAGVIVSLDADFMFDDPAAVLNIRRFAEGRRAEDAARTMSRLYCFESGLSLTGANADHRAAVKANDVAAVAAYLASRILGDMQAAAFVDDPKAGAALPAAVRADLDRAIADLENLRGAGAILVGRRQPAEVHAIAHVLNHALGNAGRTVQYVPGDPGGHAASLAALVASMRGGTVRTLVMLGGNPVHTAPPELDFVGALGDVETTIHLADHRDETSRACSWHVNRAHWLESWGDARSADGTFSVIQPIIRPLFGGRSAPELLAHVFGDETTDGQAIVRRHFDEMTGAADDGRWREVLHEGHLRGSAYATEAPTPRADRLGAVVTALRERWAAAGDGLELAFAPDYSVWDGRFANNGWMQELPDPLTKITWDNAALLGTATARDLGVRSGDRVRITAGNRSVEAAVFVVPGHAEGSVTLPLGYGRAFPGRICAGAGFDFYPLRTAAGMGFAGGATIQPGGGRYVLATTQDHHAIDADTVAGQGLQERLPELVREATVQHFREAGRAALHGPHIVHRLSLFPESQQLDGDYQWAMSIDLSACVGCNACVVACQAENNIPIVGKDQVTRGREMHWIRVDRYFRFAEDEQGRPDPTRMTGVALQPVTCMHCENAPCEQVCPVAATVHDDEGLNVMVYNRCIGTRYCSNNCPYKVRRFNYFDFHRRDAERTQPGTLLQVETNYWKKPQAAPEPLRQLQFNPEVTVRVRGVMEKCTYCTQRIQRAKIDAKNAWARLPEGAPERDRPRIPVADGAIETACQQACPAGAIAFGDLLDSGSRVHALRQHERSYQMLEELNVNARTTYLARLTNPADGGHASDEHDHDHGEPHAAAPAEAAHR